MSAFHDIWISGNSPGHIRTGCGAWTQKKQGGISLWESKPQGNNHSIVTEVSTDAHHLIVLGQFYEEVNTTRLLDACVNYTNDSKLGFEDPAGHYIIFLLSKPDGNCHVFTNRFGTYHAYWSSESGRYALSTYYMGIARSVTNKKLDWDGIAGFFTMGYFPVDKTYLDNVKIFLPASYYCFDADLNLIKTNRYWEWQHVVSHESSKVYLSRLNGVLQSSLSYSLKDKRAALPISGGLDSRTLAGVISGLEVGNANWAYSYGFTETSPEIKIARQIAKASSLPFNSHVVPNYLFDKADLIVDSVELFQYIDGTRQACMKEQLEQDADVVVGGHWGDVWLSDMGIADENNENALMDAFKHKIVKKGSNILLSLFADFIKGAGEYPEVYFKEFIDRYSHIDDTDFKLKIYKTDQWSFRWTIASIRMYQAAAMPVLPFYDKYVTDILTQVPPAMLKGRKLQVEYLKQYHPKLAKIKWQEYDSNLYNYKWLNNRNLAYRAVHKLKRGFQGKQIIRNADIFYLNADGRKNLMAIFNESSFVNFVSPKQSTLLLDEYYKNPSAANTYAVSMLHTFAQFIKRIS